MKLILLFVLMFFFYDLNAEIIYLEPIQNAKYVNIKNNIIIGLDSKIENSDLNSSLIVTGSKSGIHSGDFIITPDMKKIIFKPHLAFEYDETVKVNLNGLKTLNGQNNSLTYIFQTQVRKLELYEIKNSTNEDEYTLTNNFPSTNSYSVLPQLSVTVSDNPSPGKIFLSNFITTFYPTPYLIIAENDGSIYHSEEVLNTCIDFKRQPSGIFTYFHRGPQLFYAQDELYNKIDSFYCGNGYSTDSHDLKVLNNGHALLMSYDSQPVDMSLIVKGGQPNAIVVGTIIQEIDENKNVVFQWRSWDHYLITDAVNINLTAVNIDYCHGNAVELDNDGNLLFSARHLNEITKINRTTGDIIWRMGGINNQFTFANDTIPFLYQHDIRRIENGNVTLFDNGNFRSPVLFSRAVEYNLDEVNKIATKVWEYRNTPDLVSPSRGSAQRLKNGNTLICWGSVNPNITEVTPSGNIALEMSFPSFVYSYRAFKDEANLTLNVKLAIEGFYDPQTNLLNMNDTVRAYVRNITSPFSIVDSSKSIVDSANFNGNFRFYNVNSGDYYITLKHRNGLETWSKEGINLLSLTDVINYNFTDSINKAFGDNLILKGSKYCIYSGDINHDEFIDLTDVNLIYNNAESFVSGYTDTDVNGDNITDLTDIVITYSNSTAFVNVIKP